MTTDTDRLHFIETIQRLNNWLTRTRLPPAEFIKAGSNRVLFDDLIKPAMAPLVAKLPKPRRKPRQWRHWCDLPQAEQNRLIEKMRRRRCTSSSQIQFYLAKCSIISGGSSGIPNVPRCNRGSQYLGYVTEFAGFPINRIRNNHTIKFPTNNAVERLYEWRRSAFYRAIQRYDNGAYHTQLVPPTFVHDLHPDDVELTDESVIVDARLRKLHDLFTEKQPQPLATPRTMIEEYPLAASLFLTDAASNVEVYYCALLVPHRSAPPTLERAYLARAFNLAEQDWRVSARFKRASNALQAGLKLYGEGVAAHIHQPAAGERGLK